MLDPKKLRRQDLVGVEFIGKVINNVDPQKKGKIQARVPLIHDGVPDEDLPWSRCSNATNGLNVPNVGKNVSVYFEGGNVSNPKYTQEIFSANVVPGSPMEEDYPNSRGIFDGVNWIILNKVKKKITIHTPESIIVADPSGVQTITSGSIISTADGNVLSTSGGDTIVEAGGDLIASAVAGDATVEAINIKAAATTNIDAIAGAVINMTAPVINLN